LAPAPPQPTQAMQSVSQAIPAEASPIPAPPAAVSQETRAVDEAPPAPRARPRRRPEPAPRPAPIPEATFDVAYGGMKSEPVHEAEELVINGSVRPVWARMPSPRRLAALYPERALDRGREGEVLLHCVVMDDGALDCAPVSATAGVFEHAAMRVSRNLRHAAMTRDGHDAAGTPVNLRVVFRISDES
jgi:TonB family protein